MGIDIKLNAAHDLTMDSGDLVLVGGAERVKQQIKITLQTFLGEWFLDVSHGIPYFEKVMVKQPNRTEIEAVLRMKIKDVPDVQTVTSLSLSMDSRERRLFIEGEADTALGLVKFDFGV